VSGRSLTAHCLCCWGRSLLLTWGCSSQEARWEHR
jgi:hypothetical protein